MNQKYIKDLRIRGLKIIDIGYITVIYFTLAVIFAKLSDSIYGEFDPKKEDTKSMLQRSLELIVMIWIMGIIVYFIRNFVQLIPSPFNEVYGFHHLKVKELVGADVFTLIYLFYQSYFNAKLYKYLNDLRLF